MFKYLINSKQEYDYTFWTHYPSKFNNIKFNDIYNEINTYLKQSYSRFSCVLSDRLVTEYIHLDTFLWTPKIEIIKEEIEKILNTKIDFALVHLYKDGDANIAWHNDKEALESSVISVSFGASRTFVLREMNNNDNKHKFILSHGDMFIMKRGCQEVYEHSIIKEKNINKPRINITFRERK